MQVFLWFDLFGRFVLIKRFRNLVKADPEKDTFRISEKKKKDITTKLSSPSPAT